MVNFTLQTCTAGALCDKFNIVNKGLGNFFYNFVNGSSTFILLAVGIGLFVILMISVVMFIKSIVIPRI